MDDFKVNGKGGKKKNAGTCRSGRKNKSKDKKEVYTSKHVRQSCLKMDNSKKKKSK
jgi:hypothetical protein